ncbi:hypothetical protein GGI43DRAFT_208277 [Trichoderma evansii]
MRLKDCWHLYNTGLQPNKMDEPDGKSQTPTEDDDTSPLNILQRYDGYDWMSDPENFLLRHSNDQHSIDLPSSPEYETEPGLSPDSNLQGANFPTPMSMVRGSVIWAWPRSPYPWVG